MMSRLKRRMTLSNIKPSEEALLPAKELVEMEKKVRKYPHCLKFRNQFLQLVEEEKLRTEMEKDRIRREVQEYMDWQNSITWKDRLWDNLKYWSAASVAIVIIMVIPLPSLTSLTSIFL